MKTTVLAMVMITPRSFELRVIRFGSCPALCVRGGQATMREVLKVLRPDGQNHGEKILKRQEGAGFD